jgi:hypothetical protein
MIVFACRVLTAKLPPAVLHAVLLCLQPDSKKLQRVLEEAQPQIEQLLSTKE